MDYSDLPRILKRYKFEEKMRICNHYSRNITSDDGIIGTQELKGKVYPWELETFLLLSIYATPEYSYNDFIGKNEKKFVKMINIIRNFTHPYLENMKRTIKFVDYYIVSTGLIQFVPQESLKYKLYRYDFIFNFENENINMKKEFVRKFGMEYSGFFNLGYILNFLYSTDIVLTQEFLNHILLKMFPIAYKNLSISLEEYKKQLNNITDDTADYIYCLRPSYKYPFITCGNVAYLPLPHVIGRSITSSLLYRLTDNNNILRTKVGKEILEIYILKLLSDACIYDEIIPEKYYYRVHKTEARTLDIMLREKDNYILIDSKASVPLIGLRIFDDESYKKEINRLVENVLQVYKHLRIYFMKEYNFFEGSPVVSDEKLWGAVVVLEDSYVRRSLIYENVAAKLSMDMSSDEYNWIQNHIKVVSLYDIEKVSLIGDSIIKYFIEQEKEGNPSDFSLMIDIDKSKEIINKDYLQFHNNCFEQMDYYFLKMKQEGIIN